MRTSTARVCETESRPGTAACSGLAAAYAAPLTLPTLEGVPARLLTINGAQVSARMALSLMQIGLLTYRDWATPWQHESDLIERALTKWLRKATAELQIFQFGITYSDRRLEQLSAHMSYTPFERDNAGRVAFTLYRVGDLPAYTLGSGITELEHAVPGLGETALYHLEQAAVLPILTPCHALYLASNNYWMGEDDETLAIQEELAQLSDGLNPDDIEFYRKRDFLASIPEWAATAKPRLPLSSLRRIALEHTGTDAGTVAALILKIARSGKGCWCPDTRDEEMDCSDIAAIFRWSEDDDCGRIVDDAMNEIYNSGESTDDFGTAYLVPEAAPLKAWLRSAEKTFRLLRLCEQLVRIVGQPVRH